MKCVMWSILFLGLQLFCEATYSMQPSTVNRSVAADVDCDRFVEDLKDMRLAQDAIQQSLIANHEMMSDSIRTYADSMKETQGKAYKKISESMYKAVDSIKKRKEKAADLAKSLNEKTLEMIKTAEKCIKK